jgi:hypothetical protein
MNGKHERPFPFPDRNDAGAGALNEQPQHRKEWIVRRVRDQDGDVHTELTTREARQARLGKPVFYVLIGGICGTILGYGIAALLAT